MKTEIRFAGLMIDEMDTSPTIASSEAFSGGIYGEQLPLRPGKPTGPIAIVVHETMDDEEEKLAEMFASFGRAGEHEFEEYQVVAYRRDNLDKLQENAATFMRMKGGFVAYIFKDGLGNPRICIRHPSYCYIWHGKRGHRIVLPELSN